MPLAQSWPAEGPPVLWSVDVGEGYAGAAIDSGRVYLIDYDGANRADVIRCLSLDDGAEIWSYSYPIKVKRNHGMSRTVPTIASGYLVAIGPKCHVTCLDATTGEKRWMIDLVQEYSTTVPQWYAGQCPLIDGKRVILAPGGKALLMAVDLETGGTVWETPNADGWDMTHASVIPLTVGGTKMYVYCAKRGVVGVDASDGSLLWKTSDWKISIATVPTPVPVGDGRLFFSGGYNAGSLMAQIVQGAGGEFEFRTLFRLKASVFGATQQTPVFWKGHLWGIRPNGELVCLDLDGKPVWTSGAKDRFGLGPFMITGDGLLFAMDDDAWLTLARASTNGFEKLARVRVVDGGHEAWGPFAIAGGRLLARDFKHLVCLDVRER